jgi:hypothetical protein
MVGKKNFLTFFATAGISLINFDYRRGNNPLKLQYSNPYLMFLAGEPQAVFLMRHGDEIS